MKTLLSVLLLCSCALAQSYTVVTATLQDSSGQVWSNASWRTEFAPQPGYSGQYNNQGAPITVAQSGTADNAGTFHVTLDNNIVVSPAGSAWKFIICPNASVSSCNTINLTIFGPVMNVSSQINNILTIPVVVASPVIAHAYNDTEVSGSYGTLYINAIDNTLRECLILQCNGGGWVAISASTSNPTFTGTLTVPCVKFNFDASNDSTLCSQGATGHINFLLPTTGGTLLTSGTAGNVSNSGTPLNHQIASWIDATHIQGINPTSNNGWVLTSNGLASDPTFQALPGGGNVSNTGTPLNHQVAIWTDATHVQGLSPTANIGWVLTSNGIGSDPTFQAPGGGGGGSVVGSGIPIPSGTIHSFIYNGSTTISASSGNSYPGGTWSHLGGNFLVNTSGANARGPAFYQSSAPSSGTQSSLAEDASDKMMSMQIFNAFMFYGAWTNICNCIVWVGFSNALYGSLNATNPNFTIAAFRFVAGTDTNIQAYVSTNSANFTAQDTGVPPDNTILHQYGIIKNSTGDLDFYIDGTKVTTILHTATGFPLSTTQMYAQVNIQNPASASSQDLYVHSIRWWSTF